MLATRIEQWESDISERGIEKGELAFFLKMLELKFGVLPTWAQEKIAQADTETIENWAAKLLKVDRLEDVFNINRVLNEILEALRLTPAVYRLFSFYRY